MFIRKENIRIYTAIIITTIIFLVVWISSLVERSQAITDVVSQEKSELTEDFKNEVFNTSQLDSSNFKMNNDGKVVGFSLPYKASYSFQLIKKILEQNGWTYVSSGDDTSASFCKSSGNYQWLFANCVDVAKETCVVITVD